MAHILFTVLFILIYGCNPAPGNQPVPQDVQYTQDAQDIPNQDVVATIMPGEEGLDLTALTALAKQCNTAAQFEMKLNDPGSINNLDLDGDGNVDYINVSEYQNGNVKGFSLYIDKGVEKQEVATIEITRNQNVANVVVVGNEYLYGDDRYYQSQFVFTDFLLWSYLFSPHTFYYSPYHYGYYPGYFHPWHRYDYDAYRTRTFGYRRGIVIHRDRIHDYRSHSPNYRYNSSRYSRNIKPREYHGPARVITPRRDNIQHRDVVTPRRDNHVIIPRRDNPVVTPRRENKVWQAPPTRKSEPARVPEVRRSEPARSAPPVVRQQPQRSAPQVRQQPQRSAPKESPSRSGNSGSRSSGGRKH